MKGKFLWTCLLLPFFSTNTMEEKHEEFEETDLPLIVVSHQKYENNELLKKIEENPDLATKIFSFFINQSKSEVGNKLKGVITEYLESNHINVDTQFKQILIRVIENNTHSIKNEIEVYNKKVIEKEHKRIKNAYIKNAIRCLKIATGAFFFTTIASLCGAYFKNSLYLPINFYKDSLWLKILEHIPPKQ